MKESIAFIATGVGLSIVILGIIFICTLYILILIRTIKMKTKVINKIMKLTGLSKKEIKRIRQRPSFPPKDNSEIG
jgi:hypothetical protein